MLMVSTRMLQNYTAVARQAGLDPDAQLRAVGIDPASLLDPNASVPADAAACLLDKAARGSGLDDFALRMMIGRGPAALGPLALLTYAEPTVRQALIALQHFQRLHSQVACFLVEETAGIAWVRMGLVAGIQAPLRQPMELGVATLHQFLAHLLGPQWRAQKVCFAHGPPRSLATHLRMFGPHLEFNSELDGVVCRSSELDTPIVGGDAATALQVRRYLDSLAVPEQRTLGWEVRQMIDVLLSSGSCTAEAVARKLDLPLRTFYFRMRGEGGSFAEILDEVRRERVLRYLDKGNCRLGEVSDLLGFSGLSAFSRWFRQRFGCSASAWIAGRRAPAR